jgi:hypothetical protein
MLLRQQDDFLVQSHLPFLNDTAQWPLPCNFENLVVWNPRNEGAGNAEDLPQAFHVKTVQPAQVSLQ